MEIFIGIMGCLLFAYWMEKDDSPEF